MKQRIFSGIQPTGTIHIGNYLGALKNWVELQKDYDCIYSVVDLHAISAPYDVKEFPNTIQKTAAMLLAIGIDPEKSVLFIQSQRPEVTELAWIFNTLSNMGELTRMTQYKEKTDQFKEKANVGLFTYPLLQAADILIYKAERIPVGEDQLQHVELARTLARRFNNRFGNVFPEPEPIVTKGARIMALNNPAKKMSKSIAGSYISLTDTADEIRSKIRRAVTDSGPTDAKDQKAPAIANLFTLLNAFADDKTNSYFTKAYEDGTIRYTELKDALAEAIVESLEPIQRRYQEILDNPDDLNKILAQGAEKLGQIAKSTLQEGDAI